MTDFTSVLDELIKRHAQAVLAVEADPFAKNHEFVTVGNKTKQAVLQAVEQLCNEVIGKDEEIEPDYYEFTPEELVRNESREQQRQRLVELLKGETV